MRDQVQGKGVKISDTSTYTGNFNWIDVCSEATINAMACAIEGDMAGFVYPPGWHRVDASSIRLTSGAVIAHSE